ncbi:MAG: hypothetical protein ACRDTF_07700, partial [Pseudonocardiaceae bacterium]
FAQIFLGLAVAMVPAVVLGLSLTLAVAVGATAGMTGATRLLFSPMLFAVLLVSSSGQDTVSAAVLASAVAWLTATAIPEQEGGGRCGTAMRRSPR